MKGKRIDARSLCLVLAVVAVAGLLSLIYLLFYVPTEPINDRTVHVIAFEELAHVCGKKRWKPSDFRKPHVAVRMKKEDVFLGIGTKEIKEWHFWYRSKSAPVKTVDVYINERGGIMVFRSPI